MSGNAHDRAGLLFFSTLNRTAGARTHCRNILPLIVRVVVLPALLTIISVDSRRGSGIASISRDTCYPGAAVIQSGIFAFETLCLVTVVYATAVAQAHAF